MIDNKKYNKTYYQKHRKKLLQQDKKYYQKNKLKILERNKKYRKNNKKYFKQYSEQYNKKNNYKSQKKYYKQHRQEILKYKKEYYEKHKNHLKKARKIWLKNNPNYMSKYNKIWERKNRKKITKNRIKRLQTDMNFRLRCYLSRNLRRTLKKQKQRKTSATLELLGCNIKFLKKYLENKFTKGMSWDNYGNGKNKWCIDHIKPLSSFDLSKKSKQRKCFHYSNLQPLWFIENCRKGNKCNY